MKFKSTAYIAEMKQLVDQSLEKIARENPDFEIYTIGIWTDANAAASAVNFDSKRNSDEKCQRSNEFNKKQNEYWITQGDCKMAELFQQQLHRNCNPADFELRNFLTITNRSVPRHWEEKTDGAYWAELEPALKEVGEYAFQTMGKVKMHADIEVGVNGKLDWYQFTWTNKSI